MTIVGKSHRVVHAMTRKTVCLVPALNPAPMEDAVEALRAKLDEPWMNFAQRYLPPTWIQVREPGGEFSRVFRTEFGLHTINLSIRNAEIFMPVHPAEEQCLFGMPQLDIGHARTYCLSVESGWWEGELFCTLIVNKSIWHLQLYKDQAAEWTQ